MDTKALRAARNVLSSFFRMHPEEAARQLEQESTPEIVRVLQSVPAPRMAPIVERMTPGTAAAVLEELDPFAAQPILSGIDPARAAALLSQLDEEQRNRHLDALDPALARELRELMSYDPDTAGSLMDPRVMTFHPEATIDEALRKLRNQRRRRIHDVFLIKPGGELAGSVAVQDIAVAQPDETLANISRGQAASVDATATREEIGELLEDHQLTTLAVVDVDNRLLGVIRHEKLLATAQEEATVDIQTMVGASRQERALSKVSFAVKKRLPWLNINLATAFLAASVVGLFSDTIERFTALAVLLPVVAGQSGNTGAQALAVTMRGLALREIRARQWLKVMTKEVSVGFLNGIAIAVVTAIAVYFWSGSNGLALVIGSSMILSMVAAGFAGAVIPMILTALGQDPAQSSSIILTTITDIAGFFSFLGIATLLSSML